MVQNIDRQIAAQKAKIAALDTKIGQLMSQRVDLEEALADLLKKRTDPLPMIHCIGCGKAMPLTFLIGRIARMWCRDCGGGDDAFDEE